MFSRLLSKRISIVFFQVSLSFLPCIVLSAQDCTPDSVGNVTCSDYVTNATLNIDLRIASKHNPSTNKLVYSSQNPTKGEYIRNKNCWASNLDLTCASPWNSRGVNLQAGTLITPRHAILAAHFSLPVGASIKFITKDNVTIARKIIGSATNTNPTTIFPDIQVVTLDSDVPSSITPCQILPAGSEKFIPNNGNGLPGFFLDQEEKAIVADVASLGINGIQNYSFIQPSDSNRLAMYEPVVMGDSGNPVFIVLSGKVVLLGVITSYGPWGYSLNYFGNLPLGQAMPYQRLDDLISASDMASGIQTGYSVSFFDFAATSAIKNSYEPGYMINVNGMNLQVKTELEAELEVYNLTGNRIIHRKTNGICSIPLPDKGVYVVKVTDKDNHPSLYKIIAR